MKKAARLGGRLRPLDTLSRSDLYIGIRIVHVVVIEDVLVLAYGPRFGYVYLVHLTSLVKPRPPAAVDELSIRLVDFTAVRAFAAVRPIAANIAAEPAAAAHDAVKPFHNLPHISHLPSTLEKRPALNGKRALNLGG